MSVLTVCILTKNSKYILSVSSFCSLLISAPLALISVCNHKVQNLSIPIKLSAVVALQPAINFLY